MKLSVILAFAAVLLALMSCTEAGHGRYWHNQISGKTQWDEPNYMHKDKNGNYYYIDPATGDTSWTKPKDYAWTAHTQKEYPDREFYFNSVSGESSWEKPEVLAWVSVEDTEL